MKDAEKAVPSDVSTDSPRSIVHVGHIPPSPTWEMSSEGHDYHEIIVVIGGVLHAVVAGERVRAEVGDVLVYPAGVRHTEHADASHPCETYFFSLPRETERIGDLPTKVHDEDARLRTLAAWAWEGRHENGADGRGLLAAIVDCMIAELVYRSGATSHPMVRAVRRFVVDHISDEVTLDDLATVAGLSKYHFCRAFKRSCGRTPMEDVLHIRLEEARNLILTTSLTMSRVADLTGFSDQYHLAHQFRRRLGIAPTELRNGRRR